MPQIDKKLINALGDFMFRISNFSHAKNHEKNQRNWSLIVEQLNKIANGSLNELNDALLNTLMTLTSFGITITSNSLHRTPSQLERVPSQLSSGGHD